MGWRKKGPTDHEHTMLSLSLTLHDFALGVSSMAACYVQKSAASVIVDSSLWACHVKLEWKVISRIFCPLKPENSFIH